MDAPAHINTAFLTLQSEFHPRALDNGGRPPCFTEQEEMTA